MLQRRTRYVARKSFLVNGCYACHDIPGLENAKPIGPSLTGWGRKDTAQLAFGHVAAYVRQQRAAAGAVDADNAAEPTSDAPPGYYWEELQSQSRIGFMHQKLAEPRSFDFEDTRTKKYTARLRMPQFALTDDQREAIMTFALGLVSDPPNPQSAYQPDPRTRALVEGREVLLKYQCRSCHLLEPETWELAFPPDTFGEPRAQTTYPFVLAPSDPATLATARHTDRRNLRTATLQGMPALGADGAALYDDEEFPLEDDDDTPLAAEQLIYGFDLWKPSPLDGWLYQVGDRPLLIACARDRTAAPLRRRNAGQVPAAACRGA